MRSVPIKLIISIIILTLLLMPSTSSSAEDNNTTQQIVQELVPPVLKTSDLGLSIELPTEGSDVIVHGFVTNNDNQTYTNVRVVIYIIEESNHPDNGRSLKEIGADVISMIKPSQMVEFSITVVLDAGIFSLSSTVFYNNIPIIDSTSTITILVLSPPEGDIPTILIGLLVLGASLVLAIFVPSIYDKYRVDNALKQYKIKLKEHN